MHTMKFELSLFVGAAINDYFSCYSQIVFDGIVQLVIRRFGVDLVVLIHKPIFIAFFAI